MQNEGRAGLIQNVKFKMNGARDAVRGGEFLKFDIV